MAQGLKNHVFTGMLAQHVSSELRMHLWIIRSQTDRNTPSQMKINWDNLDITDFLIITDITDFLLFLPFFDMFEDEKNLDAIMFMECSGGEPHGDMIMT